MSFDIKKFKLNPSGGYTIPATADSRRPKLFTPADVVRHELGLEPTAAITAEQYEKVQESMNVVTNARKKLEAVGLIIENFVQVGDSSDGTNKNDNYHVFLKGRSEPITYNRHMPPQIGGLAMVFEIPEGAWAIQEQNININTPSEDYRFIKYIRPRTEIVAIYAPKSEAESINKEARNNNRDRLRGVNAVAIGEAATTE